MKNLFIPENSGYGRFVTVTVNGKPYTVPVGINTSVPDEVYTVVLESLKTPETNTSGSGFYSIPTDISLTDSHLQLTANGEAVGEGVTLPSGLRLINSISVADGATATALKISKDVDGANFSLNNIMFAARLNLPVSQTATIRLRTNKGVRYLIFKTGVNANNNVIFVSGESKVFPSIGTQTVAVYKTNNTDVQGWSETFLYSNFSQGEISKTNITDIEMFIYDEKNEFVQLQAGSYIELWGC